MRRRLDLAASLVGQPQVLVLDEPTAGLDPASRQALRATIRSLVDGGTTALLTTQYLEEADQLADDIVVIDTGRVIAHGTPDQLKAQVGGHRIELQLADPAQTPTAARVLENVSTNRSVIDERGWLVIPIAGGAAPTATAIRALDDAGIDGALRAERGLNGWGDLPIGRVRARRRGLGAGWGRRGAGS